MLLWSKFYTFRNSDKKIVNELCDKKLYDQWWKKQRGPRAKHDMQITFTDETWAHFYLVMRYWQGSNVKFLIKNVQRILIVVYSLFVNTNCCVLYLFSCEEGDILRRNTWYFSFCAELLIFDSISKNKFSSRILTLKLRTILLLCMNFMQQGRIVWQNNGSRSGAIYSLQNSVSQSLSMYITPHHEKIKRTMITVFWNAEDWWSVLKNKQE
jgi:hypothetical protein